MFRDTKQQQQILDLSLLIKKLADNLDVTVENQDMLVKSVYELGALVSDLRKRIDEIERKLDAPKILANDVSKPK